MSSLYVIQGRNRGARYDLAVHEGAITIGRESGNFVQLDDNEVSRRHAEIRRIEGRFVVGDLKSSNGTYVNNRKVERAELSSGDQIQIGRTVMVYSKDHDDERAIGLVDIVAPANGAMKCRPQTSGCCKAPGGNGRRFPGVLADTRDPNPGRNRRRCDSHPPPDRRCDASSRNRGEEYQTPGPTPAWGR